MKILELFEELPRALMPAAEQVILTPNERLARTLSEDFDARQVRRRTKVWEACPVRSWEGWLDSLWREWAVWVPGPMLLHPEQEALLWEQVVAESAVGPSLLNPRAAARRARQTRALMLAYGVPVELDPALLNEDQLAFQAWHRRFLEVCQSANLFDRALLSDRLLKADIPWPTAIRLTAFDQVTPQQRRLFQALQAGGCSITQEAPVAVAGRAVRTTFRSSDDELWTAVSWLTERNLKNPKLALVVPDLTSVRSRLERIMLDVLGTKVALGQPLGDYPVVRAACRALALLGASVSFEDLSALLRSPFVGDFVEDQSQRALLEVRLRKLHIPSQPLPDFLKQLGQQLAPVFVARLQRVAQLVRQDTDRPSSWARLFDDVLRALGWPGTRTLDSAEQQTVERFRQKLYDLQALDFFAGQIRAEEALQRVQDWVGRTEFQPSGRRGPIQILTPIEAAGQQFDSMWVAGLDDSAWPAPARPEPYLPLSIQRKHGFPHCTAEQELSFATRITQRLRQAARAAVFSSPLASGAQPLRISRLLASLPEHNFGETISETRARKVYDQRPILEGWSDERGPAIESHRARGGSRIFQLQAACPFQAFTVLRLKGEGLETVSHGLTAGERGSLVHHVLESVWKALRSSARLAETGPNELEGLARLAAGRALALMARQRPDVLHGRFLQLEEQRLTRLVLDWIEIERQRQLPFEVLATEQKKRIQLAGLELDVIIDRIDRVQGPPLRGAEGGVSQGSRSSLLVLDYKTGSVSTAKWDGQRPDEPQLPLYAATADESVHGLAFANLRRPRLRFYGSCEDAQILPGANVYADFQLQRQEWTTVLTDLAQQHLEGKASVDPKSRTTCQFCHLGGMCRVGQRGESR